MKKIIVTNRATMNSRTIAGLIENSTLFGVEPELHSLDYAETVFIESELEDMAEKMLIERMMEGGLL